MSGEFRKKKLIHIFNFFDKDKSGSIEKKDFEISGQYTSKSRGWPPGSDKYKAIEAGMEKIWDSLQKYADADNDGSVSLDEWVAMWEKFASNPSSPLEWQSLYCKFIFDLEDASGDGAIDVEEFTSVVESFGGTKSSAISSFEKMANGKTSISWGEFQELWKEFFTSNDPNAPGNFIFGENTY